MIGKVLQHGNVEVYRKIFENGPRERSATAALKFSPLVRVVDRLQVVASLLAVLAVAAAVPLVVRFGESVYDSQVRRFATEAATRHRVDAVVVNPDTLIGDQRKRASSSEWVQWFANDETWDGVVQLSRSVKPGEGVQIWVDDHKDVTSAPRTSADATSDGRRRGSSGVAVRHRALYRSRYAASAHSGLDPISKLGSRDSGPAGRQRRWMGDAQRMRPDRPYSN